MICALLAPDADAGAAQAEQLRHAFEAAGPAVARDQAAVWWRRYWHGVPELRLPDDFFQRFYHYAQYKFACAANPHARKPAPLQGPWYEEYQMPPWQGNYTVNVNIQQIYTLALSSGNTGFMLPLFDMLDSPTCQGVMRQNAVRMTGVDDGLLLTHSVNDHGCQCQGGLRPHAALDQAVTGWLAQLYWLYYRQTLDHVFLRDRAWPFMTGAMRVYEAMLEERDGRLSLPLGASPEFGAYHHQQEAGRDPSWQLACIHMLAEALLTAAELLGLPPKPSWDDIRRRLPRYSLVPVPPPSYRPPGDYGQRIGLWEHQDLPESYRHHSHLGAIYPFDSLGELAPEQQEIVDQTSTGGLARASASGANGACPGRRSSGRGALHRSAAAPDAHLARGLHQRRVSHRLHSTLRRHHRAPPADQRRPAETCEIMQLDGTMAGATALLEMLVHTRAGTVHVFPAVSRHWPDVDFAQVRVPGGFLVSGSRRHGRTARVEVSNPSGGRIRIMVADQPTMTMIREGEPPGQVALPAELELAAGSSVRLEAGGSGLR